MALFITSGDLIADRRHEMARAYAADGDLAAAADLYLQAVELAPGDPRSHVSFAQALEANGRKSEAEVEMQKAQQIRQQQ